MKTLVEALERAAGSADTGLRFLDRDEAELFLPWSEVHAQALAVCGALRRRGVRRGERVALVYPTSPEFFAAFFGILQAGGVPVPLYPPVRLGRLDEYHRRTARMLELTAARWVLADRRVRRLLGETLARAGGRVVCSTLDELPAGCEGPVAVSPGELALVQFSSGTTVHPKPVALSHRALAAQAEILNALWPDSSEVRHSGVSWLPLYHDMGLIGCVLPALERPAVLTLIGPEVFVVRPAVWLRAISRYRATISPAPNFAYGLAVAKIRDAEMTGVDLSSWRGALNGAEPVAPPVLRAFLDRFARWGLRPEALTPVYGLSEASLAVTFSPLDRPYECRRFDREALAARGEARESADGREIVSVGRPLPDFHLRVVDGAGAELPADRVGRIEIAGPSLMEGYLDQPEATARVLRDGWLDSGDLGFLHGGELYLTGRAKDIVLLRGRNYSPEEIEHALSGLPGLRAGCAVAVSWLPEGAEGEVLGIFLEHERRASREEIEALPELVRRAVIGHTGLTAERVSVLPPGTLPRTSSGKLRRGEALRRHLADELRPPAPVTPLRLAGALVRSRLAYARLRLRGSPGNEGGTEG